MHVPNTCTKGKCRDMLVLWLIETVMHGVQTEELVIITIHLIYNAPVPVLQKQAPSTVQLHTSDSIHSWEIHALKTGSSNTAASDNYVWGAHNRQTGWHKRRGEGEGEMVGGRGGESGRSERGERGREGGGGGQRERGGDRERETEREKETHRETENSKLNSETLFLKDSISSIRSILDLSNYSLSWLYYKHK